MKLKFRFLLIFCISILSSSCAFCEEYESKPYLPPDSSLVKWGYAKLKNNNYSKSWQEASYIGADGDQYLAKSCRYDSSKMKKEFFANRIYELFGFASLPQYLVDASKIANSNYGADVVAIVTKLDPNLKPFSDCSEEEKDKMWEQLAKAHIISALVGNLSVFCDEREEKSCGAVVRDQKIYFVNSVDSFGGDYNEYGPTAKDFKELIEPQSNWGAAMIFQKPFQNYTLKHVQELIDWLDGSWDEKQVEVLFEEIGLENQKLLTNLKLRFQDIKKQLEEIKRDGYEVYNSERVSQLVRENLSRDLSDKDKYVSKNISYEYKDLLPKVEEQIFICSDGSKIWLELTNFEFLVNSKESNKIVKVYLGDVSSGDQSYAIERHAVEIFDPEAAFVFSDAVIRHWDTFSKDSSKNTFLKLAEVMRVGYAAVSYHFGFSECLGGEDIDESIPSFKGLPWFYNPMKDLLGFYKRMHQKYVKEIERMDRDRLVTKNDIEKRKTQGFVAFYPNPIYLDNIAWYIRPKGMRYEDYVARRREELKFYDLGTDYDKSHLSKFSDINYDCCDEYTQILERLYPDDITYLNNTLNFHASDLKRISIYSFRGDDKTIDKVYDDQGFWPIIREKNGKYLSAKEHKQQLMDDDSAWKMPLCGNRPCPRGKNYVSTSEILAVTEKFGLNVYAVFTEGGLKLPLDFNGKKIHDVGYREIAVPGGIDWEHVVGARNRIRIKFSGKEKHLTGPVFLKADLMEDDRNNFWEILQIMGGKPQFSNAKAVSSMPDSCKQLLDGIDEKILEERLKEDLKLYFRDAGLNEQDFDIAALAIPPMEEIKKADIMRCQEMIREALSLKSYVRRR